MASDLLDEFKIATVIPGLKTRINIILTILLTKQRRFNLCLMYDGNHRLKSPMRYANTLMMFNVNLLLLTCISLKLSGELYWGRGPAKGVWTNSEDSCLGQSLVFSVFFYCYSCYRRRMHKESRWFKTLHFAVRFRCGGSIIFPPIRNGLQWKLSARCWISA